MRAQKGTRARKKTHARAKRHTRAQKDTCAQKGTHAREKAHARAKRHTRARKGTRARKKAHARSKRYTRAQKGTCTRKKAKCKQCDTCEKMTLIIFNNLFQFCRNRINNFTFFFKFITWNQISFGAFMNNLFMSSEYVSENLNTRDSGFICSIDKNIRI